MSSGIQVPSARDSSRAANFDPVARVYRWAEYLLLGPLLTRTREHFLPQLTSAQDALVLGDGDGRFLAQLLRRAPQVHVTAIDSSAAMLGLLRRRCGFALHRVQTVHSPAAGFPRAANLHATDLIVSHFFLDCLGQHELDDLARRLAREVAPGCRWVLSDFGIPPRQPWRTLAAAYVRGLYMAFRLLTGLGPQHLPDIHQALSAAGFRRIHRSERLAGILYSELWQLPS